MGACLISSAINNTSEAPSLQLLTRFIQLASMRANLLLYNFKNLAYWPQLPVFALHGFLGRTCLKSTPQLACSSQSHRTDTRNHISLGLEPPKVDSFAHSYRVMSYTLLTLCLTSTSKYMHMHMQPLQDNGYLSFSRTSFRILTQPSICIPIGRTPNPNSASPQTSGVAGSHSGLFVRVPRRKAE